MPYWERFTILAVVVGLAILLAKFVDSQIKRLNLTAANETRYRVLRRGLVVGIIFIALLAGLTVIPQVRSVAGAILASSALIAIIVGFASQRVLGNFVAGLMIAVTQPLRLGDRVAFEVDGPAKERRGPVTLKHEQIDPDAIKDLQSNVAGNGSLTGHFTVLTGSINASGPVKESK